MLPVLFFAYFLISTIIFQILYLPYYIIITSIISTRLDFYYLAITIQFTVSFGLFASAHIISLQFGLLFNLGLLASY